MNLMPSFLAALKFIMFSHKKRRAFTLIEILVSVAILSIGILGALLFLVRSMTATGISRDVTVATGYVENIFEEMRAMKTLAEILAIDWERWAQESGMNALPEQKVDISFENPEANPLGVKAMVSWKRGGQPPGKIDLYTEFYK